MVQLIGNIINGSVVFPPRSLEKYDERVSALSKRQMTVLQLIAEGKSEKQICRELTISQGTVKKHTESIFRKLKVNKRTQAAIIYHQYNEG
jgi:DNA-binding NarL/FixJ family response regulator